MFYPSEELVAVLNTIGVPHQSDEIWLCMPLRFANTEWTVNDKIGLLYLRTYIYHYLKYNNLLKFSRMVCPNELLKTLDIDNESNQISYKHFIGILEMHLYTS